MSVKIMCSHALNPDITPKALKIITKFIGPIEMTKLEDGSLYCPCGFIIKPQLAVSKS